MRLPDVDFPVLLLAIVSLCCIQALGNEERVTLIMADGLKDFTHPVDMQLQCKAWYRPKVEQTCQIIIKPDNPATTPKLCNDEYRTCKYVNASCICVFDWTFIESFSGAEAFCTKYPPSGLTVSIHSEEENDILWNMTRNFPKGVWLGLGRETGGNYTWVDQTPVDYLNLDNNTQGGGEKACYKMSPKTGQWKARLCTGELGVACRHPYIKPQTTTTATTSTTSLPTTTLTPTSSNKTTLVIIIVVAVCFVVIITGVIILVVFIKKRRQKSERYVNLVEDMVQ